MSNGAPSEVQECRKGADQCHVKCSAPAWVFLSLQDPGSLQILQHLLEEIFASGLEFRKPGQTSKV